MLLNLSGATRLFLHNFDSEILCLAFAWLGYDSDLRDLCCTCNIMMYILTAVKETIRSGEEGESICEAGLWNGGPFKQVLFTFWLLLGKSVDFSVRVTRIKMSLHCKHFLFHWFKKCSMLFICWDNERERVTLSLSILVRREWLIGRVVGWYLGDREFVFGCMHERMFLK